MALLRTILLVLCATFKISEAYDRVIPSLELFQYQNGSDEQHATIKNVSTSQVAPHAVRIVVIGRSRSGVSSTIRELIGPFTKCERPEGKETLQNIYEYTISNIPGTNSTIKIVDMPGFVDGRTLEQDSQILATLKSYLSQLDDPPEYFLALTRFDDNRIIGPRSLFVQFLRRIELFKNEFLGRLSSKPMNIIFLLTRLMSDTRLNQRKPANKINSFRRVIEEHSSLTPPYSIVVGDNHANSQYNAKIESGYYRLPNRQHYPKNIWEAMINSTTSSDAGDPTMKLQTSPVLKSVMDNRQVVMTCKAKLIETNWEEYSSDAEAFLYLLQQPDGWTAEQDEVNLKIQQVFNGLPLVPNKVNGVIQKTALQLFLQNENVTSVQANIPTNYTDRVAFFQRSSLVSSTYPALLLKQAFGLEMPEYVGPLSVGHGYDVLGDELLLKTPFKTARNLPSSVGYQFPNFMKCRKLPIHEIKTFQSFSNNISDYFEERLKHLNFATMENISLAKFTGRVEEGFNIAPEKEQDLATLTAVEEVRTLKCVLSDKGHWKELDEEFTGWVNALEPVDLYSRDSIHDWESFFWHYGTHIVVQGYGGGRLVGSTTGANIKSAMESPSSVEGVLDSILEFSNFSVPGLEKPIYDFFGGEMGATDQQIRELYDMPETQRDRLLHEWDESLNSKFDMLRTELALERISTFVKEKIDPDKGTMVSQAIELFLKGELKRQRKQRSNNFSPNATTRKTHRLGTTTRLPSSSSSAINDIDNSHQSAGSELSPPPPIQPQYTADEIEDSHQAFLVRMRKQMEQDRKNAQDQLENLHREADRNNRKHREHIQKLKDEEDDHHHAKITMKHQMERDRKKAEAQLDNIRRINQEAESRHKLLMEKLRTERGEQNG